jgi:O-methyltransferase involved in polyketide biosynthesis
VDYVSEQAAEYRKRAGVAQSMRNAPFKFTPADWHAFFAGHGWRAREMRYLPEVAKQLGRTPPLPLFARIAIGIGQLLGAKHAHGFNHSMGYAVMTRA